MSLHARTHTHTRTHTHAHTPVLLSIIKPYLSVLSPFESGDVAPGSLEELAGLLVEWESGQTGLTTLEDHGRRTPVGRGGVVAAKTLTQHQSTPGHRQGGRREGGRRRRCTNNVLYREVYFMIHVSVVK